MGDGYYQAASHLISGIAISLLGALYTNYVLQGTHVIWGVNFRDYNLTSAYLEAKSIAKAFASSQVKDAGVSLDYIEIGNEADYWGSLPNHSNWGVPEYIKQ